ncbi:MAG: hypothetical protein HY318_00190 [Armatimonadetes bacterium]|nr:hypothetical protein [Armatimonadota bacterium]
MSGANRLVIAGIALLLRCPLVVAGQPIETFSKPSVPLPLQPFTVELLDLNRGRWHFSDALGQRLSLKGPVTAYAFSGGAKGSLRLGYLCCDPEFPDDSSHAVLKIVAAQQQADESTRFHLEEPFFSCWVSVRAGDRGVYRCWLQDLELGPATSGDRYVAGLYLLVGQSTCPLWLGVGGDSPQPQVRLLTSRVGNVFTEKEPVAVTLAVLCPDGGQDMDLTVEATDYATGDIAWRGHVGFGCEAGTVTLRTSMVPLKRFGVFEVTASSKEIPAAKVRACRIPEVKRIRPESSSLGINLFQQQIWWYAYQVPLMAKAGVHWIRPWLAWENTWNTQEAADGRWDPRALDAALRRMDKYGQRYQNILFHAPSWLTGTTEWSAPPLDKLDRWTDYVEKVVTRYRGRVRYYEVWNEPDLMWPEATRHSGEHYLAVLKAAYKAAKRGDPNCVVLGLSHAGYENWLVNVGKLGAKDYMDVATIHTYAQPHDFVAQVERRRELLTTYGMGGKPLWINEFGAPAYDFSREYSEKFDCSEMKQASVLAANYALAFSCDPKMKAYWFCTYDPRDAAHEPEWTGDAGIGILYLGFLPKLSYAALAGVSRELDGRECLGRVDVSKDLHQVSFKGPVSIAWDDRPGSGEGISATGIGCAGDERIVVRDMFTNLVATGQAGQVGLDFSHGPLYVEGSRQLAAIAQAESAVHLEVKRLSLKRGETTVVPLAFPPRCEMTVTIDPKMSLTTLLRQAGPAGKRELVLRVEESADRCSGFMRLRARLEKGVFGLRESREVVRTVPLSVGVPSLIRDGGFFLGNLFEWSPERASAYTWDAEIGHATPGSLRLDAPFDRRLVHWNVVPQHGHPVHLRGWVKSAGLTGCSVTLNLALFGPDKWLKTWCLATNGAVADFDSGWRMVAKPGEIPRGSADWTQVEATLPADAIPAETDRAAFFVEVNGGGQGRIWIDDLDLWQPED